MNKISSLYLFLSFSYFCCCFLWYNFVSWPSFMKMLDFYFENVIFIQTNGDWRQQQSSQHSYCCYCILINFHSYIPSVHLCLPIHFCSHSFSRRLASFSRLFDTSFWMCSGIVWFGIHIDLKCIAYARVFVRLCLEAHRWLFRILRRVFVFMKWFASDSYFACIHCDSLRFLCVFRPFAWLEHTISCFVAVEAIHLARLMPN